MKVTMRDIAILKDIYLHKYLTSEHVYKLVFEGVSRQVCRYRLKLLWEHQFLERIHIHIVTIGRVGKQNNRPIYSLSRKGLKILKQEDEESNISYAYVSTRKTTDHLFLSHHLVVMDFLIAIIVATKNHPNMKLLFAEHEANMRRRLKQWRKKRTFEPVIVSDGVFSLYYPNQDKIQTFHIEIVRADIRGGNKKLLNKLTLYLKLHRNGFFKRVYGQENIRAVIIVTTSQRRAENLQALASTLQHGKRFFWFGSYDEESSLGAPLTSLKPQSILSKKWIDGEGDVHTLLEDKTA